MPTHFTLVFLTILFLFSTPLAVVQADDNINLTPEEKQWVATHPEVTIGYGKNRPPLTALRENGEATGSLQAWLNLLTRKTGVKFVLKTGDWNELLQQAKAHKLDGFGPLFIDEERGKHFNFSKPLFDTFLHIYASKHNHEKVTSLSDLNGKKAGIWEMSSSTQLFLKDKKTITPVLFPTYEALMDAFEKGEIHFAIADLTLEFVRAQQQKDDFRLATVITGSKQPVAIALRKDRPLLRSIVNKGLASITDAEKLQFQEQWNKKSTPPNTEDTLIRLTSAEKIWLAQHPTVWFGIKDNNAPIEFIDEDQHISGLAPEYLKHLEALLDVRFKFTKEQTLAEMIGNFDKGNIHVIPAVSEDSSLQRHGLLTDPYLSIPINIFSCVDSVFFGNLNTLYNKKVVVIKGSSIQEKLAKDYPLLTIEAVNNTKEALDLLSRDNQLAFVGNLITTSHYISKTGLTGIRVSGETPYKKKLGMLVNNDMPMLATILQKALNAIPEYKHESIYNNWISVQYKYATDYTLLLLTIVGSLLIVSLTLYWNFRLQQESSKRNEAVEALRKAKQQAEQANNAKSIFLANMSHELRSPMNAVLGFTTLLQKTNDPSRNQEYLQSIQVAGKSLLQLIDNILDLSRIEAGKVELHQTQTSITDLFSELERIYEYFANEKGLLISFGIDKSVPQTVWLDEMRLRQVLINLLSNAVKFTDQGSVYIYASATRDKMGYTSLKIEVRDTGAGIADDQKERIFGTFNQHSDQNQCKYKGTGLGLTISKRLVNMMGGEITLESQLGVGTTFTIQLPRLKEN